MTGMVWRMALIGLAAAGAACRSNDASGHDTYRTQPSGSNSSAAHPDTAADTAAPRVGR